LYVSATGAATAGDFSVYTPTATVLGAVISTNAASIAAPRGLVFAGSNIYSTTSTASLVPVTVSGNNVTETAAASTVTTAGAATAIAATAYVAMGSSVLALNATTSTLSNVGEVANISAVAAADGAATYNNLPTGATAVAKGFAGTTSGYMVAVNNGDVLVSSSNGFVQAATVINPNGLGAALSQLVSTGGTYLASDATNLYFSSNNGAAWTTITPTTAGATGGTLSISSAANGLYFINVAGSTGSLANGLYQTATPQTLSTWVQVNNIPVQSRTTYWGGTYYVLTNASTNVGVYDPATGQTVTNANVLPQNYVTGGNVSYNGTTYALAQPTSNYIWTSADLIGGVSGWTQNSAAFTGVNGVSLPSEAFAGGLSWTGKVWIATGTVNAGVYPLYTATTPTAFAISSYTNAAGSVVPVTAASFGLF
jgi:hypothetical protein